MRGSDISAFVTTYLEILGSAIAGDGAVTVGGVGSMGSFDRDAAPDSGGEQFEDATVFGGLGLVFRPRPPEKVGAQTIRAEAFGVKKGDETTPWTWRDLRLHRRFPAPKPGTIALVGYGGGFFSFDDPVDGSGNGGVSTLYVPYAFESGTPTKAHYITLSGDNESISITHGDGAQLMLLPEREIMAVVDNDTWLDMKPGKFKVQAEDIGFLGTVTIGNPATAAPLLGAAGTLPSTRLLYSQL
jgi:hypothetical protein